MIHPSEEKWLALPVERKLEYYDIHKKLMEAETKKIELLGQLRDCLTNSWMTHMIGERKTRDLKWFYGFVTTYYARLRANATDFCYRDVAMPMPVAEIAIEWMTPYYKKQEDPTPSWRGQSNPVTVRLYHIRKDHERRLNPREETY